jgi:Ran GTPase-activating protein (RanGAP) involved in mRNA processing and transport
MPNLKRLDLSWCGVGDDGFVALVSALEQNTSLRMLVLRGNDFGERGYVALAESLPNIKGLQQINITANGIVPSSVVSLQQINITANGTVQSYSTFGRYR